MNRAYIKNIIRTIRGSMGRYLALICIVMLGVIFYVGLKITTTDMIDTANDFYNETNFYDYCYVSNYGFATESVAELCQNDDINNAEGAFYQDYIVDVDNGEKVCRFHSITDFINKLDITEGRLPESDNECVLDARYFESDIIGQKVVISELNTEENLDKIEYMEFTVTGLVNSPLYLNYQRGTTSVGSGSINSFVFVNYDAFSVDYYTQIYVDSEDGYYIYSDEYNAFIDDRLTSMEEVCDLLTIDRYNEAVSELNDAEADYEEALADYNEGCDEYDTNYADYEAALSDYDEGVSNYESNVSQRDELQSSYDELLDSYDAAMEQGDCVSAEALLAASNELLPQLEYMNEALSEYEAQLENAKNELDDAKNMLDDAKADLDDAGEELNEALEALDVTLDEPIGTVMTREDNQGYSTFKDNADIVRSIAYIFPFFFALVAALVCITTMSRMVDEERTQIGVMKALGYSKAAVFAKFIFYSLSASILGSVLGFFIGSYLFPTVIWKAYMLMYTFTDHLNILHNYTLLIASFAAAFIILVGSTIFACARIIAEKPAEMVRPKAPAAGKKILLEKLPFIWKRLSFKIKISLRNCFRYKKRFFMMLIGIAGCTALIIIGFGIKDSISSVCNLQYGDIEVYDYLITFKDDITDSEEEEAFERISAATEESILLHRGSGDIDFNGTKKSVTISVCRDYEELSEFIKLNDGDSICYPKNENECVLSKNLADSLEVKTGEKITLSFDNYSEAEYNVVGIYNNYVNNYIYLTDSGYSNGCGEVTAYNCALANTDENTDIYEKLSELAAIDNVSNVSATQMTLDYFNDMVKSLNVIVYLVIGCAAVLAFVVLYNLNNINIMERTREIATIKVLGFFRSEVSAYVFRENIVLTFLGTLLGMPLGFAMHRLIMSKIKIDLICFDVHVEPISYLYGVCITIIFSIIVDFVMRGKISGINMSESLKAIE